MGDKIIEGIQHAEKKAEDIIAAATRECEAAIQERRKEYAEKLALLDNELKKSRSNAISKAAEDSRNNRDTAAHREIIEALSRSHDAHREKAISLIIHKFLE